MSPFLLRGSRAYIVLCLYGCNVLSGFVQKVSSRGNFFDLVPGHFILQPQGRQRRKSLGTMVFCAVFIDFRVLYICFFQMKTDSKYLLTKRADFYSICYSLSPTHLGCSTQGLLDVGRFDLHLITGGTKSQNQAVLKCMFIFISSLTEQFNLYPYNAQA